MRETARAELLILQLSKNWLRHGRAGVGAAGSLPAPARVLVHVAKVAFTVLASAEAQAARIGPSQYHATVVVTEVRSEVGDGAKRRKAGGRRTSETTGMAALVLHEIRHGRDAYGAPRQPGQGKHAQDFGFVGASEEGSMGRVDMVAEQASVQCVGDARGNWAG